MAYDVDQLLEKTDAELDALFSQSEPGPIRVMMLENFVPFATIG